MLHKHGDLTLDTHSYNSLKKTWMLHLQPRNMIERGEKGGSEENIDQFI